MIFAEPRAPLQHIVVSGGPVDAGRAYGEAAARPIAAHLSIALSLLERRGVDQRSAERRALAFASVVGEHLPWLADEIDGVAVGAGIDRSAAWILQLRAELAAEVAPECSALALRDPDGEVVLAQNVDLPEEYRDLMVILERRGDGSRPRLVSLTTAGQVGQNGMNADGVTVLATSVHSSPWRVGVPRYHLTRAALAHRDRPTAVDAVRTLPRGGSRSMLIGDERGATFVETTPDQAATLEMADEPVAHTNHFLTLLRQVEAAPAPLLHNSQVRLGRLLQLAGDARSGSVEAIARVFADRVGAPHALYHRSDDDGDGWATVATVIARPQTRTMWITRGHPAPENFLEVSVS